MDDGTSSRLLKSLARVAREVASVDELDGLLQRLTDLGDELVESCDGVSMMLIGRKGRIITPAYSSQVAYESDRAQYAAGEGPLV